MSKVKLQQFLDEQEVTRKLYDFIQSSINYPAEEDEDCDPKFIVELEELRNKLITRCLERCHRMTNEENDEDQDMPSLKKELTPFIVALMEIHKKWGLTFAHRELRPLPSWSSGPCDPEQWRESLSGICQNINDQSRNSTLYSTEMFENLARSLAK